jgi:DNA-binding MarR family transcriptional regulator
MSDASRAMNGLRRIVRALRAGNSEMERAIGVSSAQLFALREIARRPGESLSQLAAATLTTQSSVSEVVTRLIHNGLVVRKVAADDHRRTELVATRVGRASLAKAPETAQEKLLTGFRSLPKSRQQEIAAGLEAWIGAAQLEHLTPTMFFENEAEHRRSPQGPESTTGITSRDKESACRASMRSMSARP